MNLSYLREFTILAEEKNYWEAAERLYMNQSTLSKHIKAMEEELDVKLFNRSTRRVELTVYGEALLPYALDISRQEYEYSAHLMQIKNQENGLLMIGCIPSMAQYNIINLLAEFQRENETDKVQIIEEDSNRLLTMLENKKCELIFLRESKLNFEKNFLTDDSLVRIPYLQDHLIAVLPAAHPFASKENINLRDLEHENICLIKEGSLLYDLCIMACHASGFIPKVSFTSHRIESLLDMVTQGNHVALIMNYHAMPPKHAFINVDCPWVAKNITPDISTQISLCYLANQDLSPAASRFVHFFETFI